MSNNENATPEKRHGPVMAMRGAPQQGFNSGIGTSQLSNLSQAMIAVDEGISDAVLPIDQARQARQIKTLRGFIADAVTEIATITGLAAGTGPEEVELADRIMRDVNTYISAKKNPAAAMRYLMPAAIMERMVARSPAATSTNEEIVAAVETPATKGE